MKKNLWSLLILALMFGIAVSACAKKEQPAAESVSDALDSADLQTQEQAAKTDLDEDIFDLDSTVPDAASDAQDTGADLAEQASDTADMTATEATDTINGAVTDAKAKVADALDDLGATAQKAADQAVATTATASATAVDAALSAYRSLRVWLQQPRQLSF